MKPQTKTKLLFGLVAFTCAVAWTAAFGFLYSTLVTGWIVAAAAFLGAAIFFPLGRIVIRRQKESNGWNRWTIAGAYALYIALAAPLGITAMLGMNRISPSEPVTVTATASKYTTRENEYRTVGRRRVYKGEHNVYHLRLTLPDGRSISRRITVSEYVATRSGKHFNVILRRGSLGFDIVGDISAPPSKAGKKRPPRE